MSYTEAQLWELMNEADEMAYGPGHIALVEQIVAHADALRLPKLGFVARREAIGGYRHLGESTKALVAFAWCVTEFDRDPTAYEEHYNDLLWDFKFAVGALTRSPEVPLDRTYAVLDDMQRRWVETGHSLHAVYSHRHRVARHLGDFDTAARYYELWCAATRDDLSDCGGCDPEMKAYWLKLVGRDEDAVAMGNTVLSGQWTCSEQPQSMLTTLMIPYLRTGRLDEARDAHHRAYRVHRTRAGDLAEVGEHIEFCARTGNEARALELVERHIGWLDRAPLPWDTMIFVASAALALRRAQARNPGEELTVFRPGTDEREAGRLSATALADQLATQATEIAGRFDRRNGTDHVGGQVRALLDAEPLVDHLPLSRPTPSSLRPSSTLDTPVATPTDTTLSGRSMAVADLFSKTAGAAPPSELDYDEAVQLAQTEQAAQAVRVLAEAVADRTARGDGAGAADARHNLAIAYLNAGKAQDAAEVAEEELAYRLRAQAHPEMPAPATPTRRLLTAIYLELGQPMEAIAQIDATAEDCRRIGDDAGAAGLSEQAGDILDRLDHDEEAAARYLVAAERFAEADRPFDEIRNRRQHAVSLTWVHGADRGLAALAIAGSLLEQLTGDERGVAWERAKHAFDEARIRWRAAQHGLAAQLAGQAADAWRTIDELRGASEACALQARLLLDGGQAAEAEITIRQALAELPDPQRRPTFVSVLDAALRAQARVADADACWAEYGLSNPE